MSAKVILSPTPHELIPAKSANQQSLLTRASVTITEIPTSEDTPSGDSTAKPEMNDGPFWMNKPLPQFKEKSVDPDDDWMPRPHGETEHVYRWAAIDELLTHSDADVVCIQESIYNPSTGVAQNRSSNNGSKKKGSSNSRSVAAAAVHTTEHLLERGGYKFVSQQQGITHAGYTLIFSKHPFVYDGAVGPDDASMTYNFPLVVVELAPTKLRVCVSCVHMAPFPDCPGRRQKQLCKVMNSMLSVCCPTSSSTSSSSSGSRGGWELPKGSSAASNLASWKKTTAGKYPSPAGVAVNDVKLCVICGDTNMLNAERLPAAFPFVDVFDCLIHPWIAGDEGGKGDDDVDDGVTSAPSFSPSIKQLKNPKERRLNEEFATMDGVRNNYNGQRVGKFSNRYDRVLFMEPERWCAKPSSSSLPTATSTAVGEETRTEKSLAVQKKRMIREMCGEKAEGGGGLVQRLHVVDVPVAVCPLEVDAARTEGSMAEEEEEKKPNPSKPRHLSDHFAVVADFELSHLLNEKKVSSR